MDEQNQVTAPDQPQEVVQQPQENPTASTPWLKYAEIIFVILAIFNLGLFSFYLIKRPKPLSDKLVGTEDNQGFLLTKPDQTISREGYSITFSNPRYEHLSGQDNFKVDVTLKNESIEPRIKVIANCDVSENGQVIKQGVGVSVESGEAGEVTPGNSANWTALVILDNKDQRVSSCVYAPEGIFDPNQTIRVVF